jgi:hypothetical protein
MEQIQPNLDWYRSLSREYGVPTHCPFANVNKCPRYYQSLSLLGEAGITTRMPKDKDEQLLERWEKNEHWPMVAEHATSITSIDDEKRGFHNFCPEVSFDVFGLFATYLHRYADEIDRDSVHARLGNDPKQYPNDWRWNWSTVEAMHFTDCPLYSALGAQTINTSYAVQDEKKVLQLKPGAYGVHVDLRELWKRIRNRVGRGTNART